MVDFGRNLFNCVFMVNPTIYDLFQFKIIILYQSYYFLVIWLNTWFWAVNKLLYFLKIKINLILNKNCCYLKCLIECNLVAIIQKKKLEIL
jgi:hypothetical protein